MESFYTDDNIRRKDRIMGKEASISLIKTGEYGILATISPEGQPYGVPLSYVLSGKYIFVHCASEGRKLINIQHNKCISFTIVGRTHVKENEFTTEYESVILFGEAYIVENEEEKIDALILLSEKYCKPALNIASQYIQKSLPKTTIIKLKIEKFTGKTRKQI